MPKNAVAILEGESLVNDASSLVVFRFALAAVPTGAFLFRDALMQFAWVCAGGVGIGVACAYLVFKIHGRFRSNPNTDTALTLLTPYLLYLIAEQVHASGVLAVVSGGLFLSFRAHRFLKPKSALQATGVWSTVIFLLNGVVFVLIGLQAPRIFEALTKPDAQVPLMPALGYALALTASAIFVRLAFGFSVAYIPNLYFWRKTPAKNPSWQSVFLVGWAGMRGVVSLASAFAIPLLLQNGERFPFRDLIVFVTFVAIFCTLVLQGLSLPTLVRWLRFDSEGPNDSRDEAAKLEMHLAKIALAHLETNRANEYLDIQSREHLLSQYRRLSSHSERIEGSGSRERYKEVLLEVLELQREELIRLRHLDAFDYALTRAKENELVMAAATMGSGEH